MQAQFQSAIEAFYRFLISHGYDHPIHPTQVNMPIGLATGAVVFLIAALVFGRSGLKSTARHCLILAFLFMFPTAIAGIMDWQCFYGGVWLFPIKVKIGLASAFFVFLIWGIGVSGRPERTSLGFFVPTFLAFCAAVALGYFGGNVVFGGRVPATSQGHEAGETIFSARCSGCHPYGGNILAAEHSIIDSDQLSSAESFIGWIRDPIPPMPSFPPDEIPDDQAHALFDYLSEIWGGSSESQPAPTQAPSGSPPPSSPPQGSQSQGPNQ